MSQEERDKRMKEAREHLRFVCTLYKLQHDEGRYFVHEHPQGAGSWTEDVIEHTREYTGAEILTIDQCQYGLLSTMTEGEVLPALKPTKIMTNCEGMGPPSTRDATRSRTAMLASKEERERVRLRSTPTSFAKRSSTATSCRRSGTTRV